MDIQKVFIVLLLCQVLPGCAVNLHGTQAAGNGASTTTLASSVNAGARAGQASVSASFGSSPPAGGAGGQIGFSRGAAAILLLGLVIAETVEFIGSQFSTQQTADRSSVVPRASIADTCSCYGWKPQAAAPLE
jgi:hypothetical protein